MIEATTAAVWLFFEVKFLFCIRIIRTNMRDGFCPREL